MNCPDCKAYLRADALRCGCGWTARDNVPPIECAHHGCGYHANVRVQTKTGWATLCAVHYKDHFHEQAIKSCKEKGLNSVADCKKWLRENKLQFKRLFA